MINGTKGTKGITLVALVITIIVLLILAGVSISMVSGENGVLINASKAVINNRAGEVEEIRDLWNAELSTMKFAEIEARSLAEVRQELVEKGLLIDTEIVEDTATKLELKIGERTIVFTAAPIESLVVGKIAPGNQTLQGAPANYKNPTIPKGFKAVADGGSWTDTGIEIAGWDDGVVIEDVNKNQFVWVPACDPSLGYMKRGFGTSLGPSTCVDPTDIEGKDTTTTYGGFWIARYEAGIPSSLTEAINTESKTERNDNIPNTAAPVTRVGEVPWNYIDWSKSKIVAENMYNNSSVQSSLVNGAQWDTVMEWVSTSGGSYVGVQVWAGGDGSLTWGNYYNNSIPLDNITINNLWDVNVWITASSTTLNQSRMIKTGASNTTKVKNIYDLAGNLWEWTDEMSNSDGVCRGGDYTYNSSTSGGSRREGPPVNGLRMTGFRCALYLK